MDQKSPGDRKSSCLARMRPVGLAFKHSAVNPYTGAFSGELMIIHVCANCGRISPNRIAGDDNPYSVISLLEDSASQDADIRIQIANSGIDLLTQNDRPEVRSALYGHSLW